MIEIDDAGSGSLIGGTGIGIIRKETKEYLFEIIPLEYFQQPYFSEKRYQDYVINILQKAEQQLNIPTQEPIFICRGYIFDKLRCWLENNNRTWESVKITGLLQEKVESSFDDYVINMGLPHNFIKHSRYAFGFHRLLKWVFADFENRSELCKRGWKSWKKWSGVPRRFYSGTAEKREFCLKCGLPINIGEDIFTMEYTTNKLWSVNLHAQCYRSKAPTVYLLPAFQSSHSSKPTS